jgi:surface carbohydrate biosynthesis protein
MINLKFINKPLFFLPVESTPRELDYKLNIARHLCREGFDIIIGNPPFIRDELFHKNYQGGFLEKGMNPTPEYYRFLETKNILTYCLSDEGAAHPAFSVDYQPAVETLKMARKIFLWGEFQKDDLIARNSDPELIKKYLVTGYPGLELSIPKYRDYHRTLKPKNVGENYILVNTNFGSINGYSMEEICQSCSAMSPTTKKTIQDSYENERKGFPLFRQWLEHIIRNFPEEQFLIRPHPVEKKEIYETLFKNYKNVMVSQEGNANQIISGAKLVLHNDCTTALQSYLADVPVISLANSNMVHIRSNWAVGFGAQPKSQEKACQEISYVLAHKRLDEETRKTIDRHAKEVMGKMFCHAQNSTEIVVKAMLSEMKLFYKDFVPYQLQDSRTLKQKIKVFIRKFLPLHYKVPVAARTPLAPFSAQDLHIRLRLFNKIEGRDHVYKIKKLFPNTYFISQE